VTVATLKWNGDAIKRKMAAAATVGISETMAECVADAKANHPDYPPASQPYERYANRSGTETGSIMMHPPTTDGLTVSGRWGGYTEYSLFLEIGTSRTGPTAFERAEAADGNMDAITPPLYPEGVSGPGWGGFNQPPDPDRPRTGPLMAPRPFLRPAADRHYGGLARKIAENYNA
jgi:hypothetical protein